MATAGSIVVSLLMNTSSFETDTKRAESIAKKRAEAIDKAFSEMGQKIGLAATAAGGAIAAMVVSAANSAKEISNLASISGAGAQEFQRFAAGAKTVGIEQDKLGDIFKDFREKVGEFVQTGGGGMKDFFEQVAPKVGITAEAFRNLSGPQALQLYVDSLEKAGLSQEQMSFYLESMASDTTALIPLLRDGGKQMKELGDQASRTGQILNEETIFAAKQLSLNMQMLQGNLAGLKNEIASALIPTLVNLTDEFLAGIEASGGFFAALRVAGFAKPFEDAVAGVQFYSKEVQRLKNEQVGVIKDMADFLGLKTSLELAEERLKYFETVLRRQRAKFDAILTSDAGAGRSSSGYVDPRILGRTSPEVTVGSGLFNTGSKPKTNTPKAPRTSSPRTNSAKEEAPFVGPMPNVDLMERYLELEKEAVSLRRSLMSDNEVRAEQEAKYFELLGEGLITQEEFNKAMAQPVEEGYWEKWLESAEEAMTSFDELAGSVVENFSSQFGNAFEKMIFDSESLGESISGMAEGMARSVVNALGQMAAQWIAYQLVQMMVGKTTAATAASATALEAQSMAVMAGLNAFAATAAIPIVGPALAPAAMTAAMTVAQPMAMTIAGLSASAAAARATGGPVSDGKPYLVGERGAELFVPNTSGAIVPNHKLGGGNVTVNMIEDKSRAGKTQERMNNGTRELDVFVADIMGDGPRSKAIRQAFGLQRRGY